MEPPSPTRRFSPAVVISLVALVVALTASPLASYARALITGDQIAPNAITTPKIKNGTVSAADLKDGAVGIRELGTGAKSHVYFKEVTGNFQLSSDFTAKTTMSTLSLPRGSYVLIGSSALTNTGGQARRAYCYLVVNDTSIGINRAVDISAQRSTNATVTGIVTIASPTVASFSCYADSSGVYAPAGSRPSLTAVSVHTITNQS